MIDDEPNFANHVAAFAPELPHNAGMKKALTDHVSMRRFLDDIIDNGDEEAQANARRAVVILEAATL